MRLIAPAVLFCLLLALPVCGLAAGAAPKEQPAAPAPQAEAPAEPEMQQAALEQVPLHMDKDLAREHERFSRFARNVVTRMNDNIIGGKRSMQVHRGSDGLFHGSFKAIDQDDVVCQVRRSESNPQYYVGNLIYSEQVLSCTGRTADACRQGPFETVSEKSSRLIYTSKRGGGWD